jgi:flagellar biosynthesis anti-sigma factor FlgM
MVESSRAALKFSNGPPILELQGNRGRKQSMRIDLNQGAQPPGSSRNITQSPASAAHGSSASSPLGEDQAQFSGVHAQVQALAAQVLQLPEVRQEKVNALRQMVLGSSYQPSSEQVAEALFAHMLVKPAA